MVTVASLWLPIVLAAVAVFIVSSVIHMMLNYHANDFRALPAEDAVMEALRKFDIPPGDYAVPKPGSMAAMKSPAFMEKRNKGPVFLATFMKPGPMDMGGSLAKWFLFSVVVNVFAAYVAGRTLGPGSQYLVVFRVVGTVVFMGYALGIWPITIWYKRSLATTLLSTFDGLVYALVTAGMFGWLWPK